MNHPKIALVTGGNRGIGFETCRQLARQGTQVLLTSRNREAGEEACEKLLAEHLVVDYHPLDVTDPGAVADVRDYVQHHYGRLDILINNAGVYLDEGQSILQISKDIFQTTLEVNLQGPFFLCQTFIPLMQEHQFGRIVNVSSGYGSMEHLQGPYTGAYKVSKISLNSLTRLMADAVDSRQIKVNAVDPGWVRTEMGGQEATLSPEEAAKWIVWAAMLPENGPTGGFFYKGEPQDW